MVVSCGDGILVSAQSSEKEGVANRNIFSCRRPGQSSKYKDSLIIIIIIIIIIILLELLLFVCIFIQLIYATRRIRMKAPLPRRRPVDSEAKLQQELSHIRRKLVSWTERAPRESKRIAEQLPCLRILTAMFEDKRQLARYIQRTFVTWTTHASRHFQSVTEEFFSLRLLAAPPECGR